MPERNGGAPLIIIIIFALLTLNTAVAEEKFAVEDLQVAAIDNIVGLLNGRHGDVIFKTANNAKDSPRHGVDYAFVTRVMPLGIADVSTSDTVTLFRRPLNIVTYDQGLKIAPRRVIVLASMALAEVHQLYPDAEIISSTSVPDAIKQLRSGAVDGVITTQLNIQIYANDAAGRVLNFHPLPGLSVAYGFRVSNANPALMEKVKHQVSQFPSSLYQALADRRELIDVISSKEKDVDYIWKYVVGTLLASLIVTLLILVHMLHTKRLVAKQLRDATIFWETLIESIPTPVVVCTADGIISHCNHAFLEILHLGKADVIRKPISFLNKNFALTPPLTPVSLVSALASEIPVFFEATITSDMKKAQLLQWASKYHDADSVPRGIVIGWTDISHRKLLEEKLGIALNEATQASDEKSRFLARMSHEIRSPLNIILGALDMEMEQKTGLKNSMLPVAHSAAIHLLDIVGQVLDLSKIEAGEMRLNIKPVQLEKRLTDCCVNYQFIAERKGLIFSADFSALNGKIYFCDNTKIIQTISNLLSNAIKYTNTGNVNVFAETDVSQCGIENVAIVVSDSGVGIPAEKIPAMMEPYTQTGDVQPGSTGLGLNIVQQFVNLMGAQLDVDSRPGRGSVFRVSLPLRYEVQQENEVQFSEPLVQESAGGLKILLVDDSSSGLMIIARQLHSFGHEVITATDGKEALEKLLTLKQVDIIITDCNMPVMDGYDLARQVRCSEGDGPAHHPILGITANAFSDEEGKCLSAGMDGVLIKPFRADTLERTIRNLKLSLKIDMEEVDILTADDDELRIRFINEMLSGADSEIPKIEDTAEYGDSSCLKETVHRLKGVYAFAGFSRGHEICEEIEWMLKHNQADVKPAILRLKQSNYHFVKMLRNEMKV